MNMNGRQLGREAAIGRCVLPEVTVLQPGSRVKAPERMLFVSGQVGVDANGNVRKDIGEQAKSPSPI